MFFLKILKFIFWSVASIVCGVLLTIAGVYLYLSPNLPSAESLKTVELQMPLKIYSADHKLIAEFGDTRRTPISFQEIPEQFIHAILSAEDDNFETHHGVDFLSLMRAASELIKTGKIKTGGSTITMQVAKNFFLSSEKSFSRKANEILLALQIERELTKDEILALYVNKIFLGNRAYGIEAAANVYYGKSINELSLAQLAMIAGLPKAPSRQNPITDPERSMIRRDWILGRMLFHGYINQTQYEQAIAEPQTAKLHISPPELNAPYLAEMARAEMVERYGSDAYTAGYTVQITVNSDLQEKAIATLRSGLLNYEYRHGYRGAEKHYADAALPELKKLIAKEHTVGDLEPAIVTSIDNSSFQAILKDQTVHTVSWKGMQWARKHINVNSQGAAPRRAADIVKVGDVIRLERQKDGSYKLSQLPKVQGALVSIDPTSGKIKALAGGFSFDQSKYNRATQAKRQVGSSFKPFIYSAALDKGYTPASMINDSPQTFYMPGAKPWTPKNADRNFLGPISFRTALYRSRNVAAAKILQSIGIDYAVDYITKFGFPQEELPRSLPLALGTADFTPLEVTTGWATFANGGYKITPYLVESIYDRNGQEVYQANPAISPKALSYHSDADEIAMNEDPVFAEQIIDERTAYVMTDILKDVIRRGTAGRARALNRQDLAGKTGTTNDAKDTWFVGYNRDLVTTVWTGYDQPSSLGRREFGSTFALPIWINFTAYALNGVPSHNLDQPEGLQSVRVDNYSGLQSDDGAIEYFKAEDPLPPKKQEFHYETPMDFF